MPSPVPSALPDDFIIDVHTHVVPDVYTEALIAAGERVVNGTVLVDGFMTPAWDLESYMLRRDQLGCSFSMISMTSPGVNFVEGIQAATLARKLNELMAKLIEKYPARLGAFAVLPAPDITASINEIKFCLDTLKFDGIGLYTNYNQIYLGSPDLDPIMSELNARKATVFVHPTAPSPAGPTLGLGDPVMEYPFDTTRAMVNMVLNDTVSKFPEIKFIFSHGGGTLPFLADRLSGILQVPSQGAHDRKKTEATFKSFYFDLATSCSPPQLAALDAFIGAGHVLIGTDGRANDLLPKLPDERLKVTTDPYFPQAGMVGQFAALKAHGYSNDQLKMIKHGNALSLFPNLKAKLDALA